MPRRLRPTHTVDIERSEQTGTNEVGEPIYETVTVAEDVPFAFREQSTSFVRQDTGERVQRPATGVLLTGTDVEEGDQIEVGDVGVFEVRGINPSRDRRKRGRVVSIEVELERAD
ncbi:hypothetical protein [Natrarchaeobaculum sulfurireducens]|uniref:Uncharacterized protein n=1 Tax=Natrarchaeobaculum sulfurireducens TaxID=2044521 RepID=A0A346PMP4_9EURY|nr:hypothetical protein [Natrarchaeobaculum sulfurireducens]AXR80789.1 hypothetical protein AArcMg_0767 [Natrarchaeobaculum sulfurireducens]